jgi:ectoine hydrolase
MTFHLMLGNWLDEDFGYALSETFAITATGSESFSRLARELFVV